MGLCYVLYLLFDVSCRAACWRAVQEFKAIGSATTRATAARALYERFLRVGAADEVNIGDSLRRDVENRLAAPVIDVDLFEHVETTVAELMRNTHYHAFLKHCSLTN